MKIIFAGTPSFAAVALEALIHSSHRIVGVFTQPDRPAGRGLKLTASPVKALALEYQLPIFQPLSLKDSYEQAQLDNLQADVMVVAAYAILLPAAVLRIPKRGCVNIHPSLLPRWRGAAPIQRAIFSGDTITGISIMQMDQGLDTGPVLLQKQYVLEPDETAETLQDKLAVLGAKTLIEALDLLEQDAITPRPQDNSQATYAHKISKEEALIDWTQSAIELEHEIRAFNPWPVAFTTWQGKNVRIWNATAVSHTHNKTPRTIISASAKGIEIATGEGVLRLKQIQLPGGKKLNVDDFYNAHRKHLIVGEHFI